MLSLFQACTSLVHAGAVLIDILSPFCCRRSSSLRRRRGDHEDRGSRRVVGESSRRVTENDDQMDCDYESGDEEMISRERVPSRRLPSSSRASVPSSGSDEDINGGYDGGGESSARRGIRIRRRNAGAVGQRNWVPPAGYFDPYFEGIRAQVQDMID